MSRMRQKRKARAEAAEAEVVAEAAEAAAEEQPEQAAADEPDTEAVEASDEAEAEGDGDEGEGEASNVEPLRPSATGRLEQIVESLLFASDKPLAVKDLKRLLRERDVAPIQEALDSLVEHYAERGIVLHHVAGAYQFRTAPSNSEWVTKLVAGRPVRLTRAQLETLAIIAYRQPITRPEIEEIRGVDTGSSLRVLLDRGLIRILGKKEEPGRPMLYGTTREFLEFFNLNDLRELPTLREFHELTEDSMREVERLGMDAEEDEGEGTEEAGDGSEGTEEALPRVAGEGLGGGEAEEAAEDEDEDELKSEDEDEDEGDADESVSA